MFDPIRPERAEHGPTHLTQVPANGLWLQSGHATQHEVRENATLCAEHVP